MYKLLTLQNTSKHDSPLDRVTLLRNRLCPLWKWSTSKTFFLFFLHTTNKSNPLSRWAFRDHFNNNVHFFPYSLLSGVSQSFEFMNHLNFSKGCNLPWIEVFKECIFPTSLINFLKQIQASNNITMDILNNAFSSHNQ